MGKIEVNALKTCCVKSQYHAGILYLVVMGPAADGVCACVYSSSLEVVCASVYTVLGAK